MYPWETFSWALSCYHAGWMLSSNVFFLQTVLLEDVPLTLWWVVVPAWSSPAVLWGKCPGVVRCDVPREVDWARWAHCVTYLVIWPHAVRFLPMGTLEYWRAHSENSCCSYNCHCWHIALSTGKYHAAHCLLPQNPQQSFQTLIVSMWGTLIRIKRIT
jgi:hypothetical protein